MMCSASGAMGPLSLTQEEPLGEEGREEKPFADRMARGSQKFA